MKIKNKWYTIGMPTALQSSQKFVPIKEVRDGVVILKDGSLRGVLMCSSVNLALKSADEQAATIIQFQNFLNSLDFSIQIVVQSRRLDIRPYLLMLEKRIQDQLEPLLKMQTREYIEFIRSFNENYNIMKKQFFIVVSYQPGSISFSKGGNPISDLLGFNKQKTTTASKQTNTQFEEDRSQLEQRIAVVQQGLVRAGGVQSVMLGTEEVIELFYKIFNPGETAQHVKNEIAEVVQNK